MRRKARRVAAEGSKRRPPRKFPDDPKIRVELSEGFRRELSRVKQASVAAAVPSPRQGESRERLDPSSVSRYVAGKVAPTLGIARRLAAAVGRPWPEAVAAYEGQQVPSGPGWGPRLLFARSYRRQALALIERFVNLLGWVHLGVVEDRARQYRRVVRPAADRAAYAFCEIWLEAAVPAGAHVDMVVAYRLLHRPPMFIDFGLLTVTADGVHALELWTGREDGAELWVGVRRFWIQTWVDALAPDFVLRAAVPFDAGPMCWQEELPEDAGPIVAFHPSGMHQHAPAGQKAAPARGKRTC